MIDHGLSGEPKILDFKSPIKLKFPKRKLRKDFEKMYIDFDQSERGEYSTLQTQIEVALNQILHLKSVLEKILDKS